MVGAGRVHLGTFGGLSLLMHASSSDALTCISPVVSKGPGHLADGFTLVCTEPGSLACLGSISDLMCRVPAMTRHFAGLCLSCRPGRPYRPGTTSRGLAVLERAIQRRTLQLAAVSYCQQHPL